MRMHKGVAYFDTWQAAAEIRGQVKALHPSARVVPYIRGYAVQYRISGPYFPELEDCAWCGGEIGPKGCANKAEEFFCTTDHRSASNRARDRFLERGPKHDQ